MTVLPWPRPAGIAAVLIAVAGMAGCDRPSTSGGAAAAEKVVLQPSDVHVFGASHSIAVVQDLEVLPDGRVWVLNSVEPFFVGFGPDGHPLGEHGHRGGGPEEFSAPVGFVAGGMDGEAWVLDGVRNAVIEVSRPDAPRSEVRLPRDSLPPGSLVGGRDLTDSRVRTARLGEEVVLARTTGSLRSGIFSFWRAIWGADLLALDPATGSARSVISLSDALGDPTPKLQTTGDSPPFPLWFRLWAVCSDRIRVYDRLRMEVRTFTSDGDELEATPLPRVELGTVTRRQFARAVLGLLVAERLGEVGGQISAADSTRLLNDVVGEVEGEPNVLATFLPRYVDLRCGADGTLWLLPFDIDEGGLRGGRSWLRITPDDVVQEVRLPDRFDGFRFTGDRIWGVQRDELDVAAVAWIEVPAVR